MATLAIVGEDMWLEKSLAATNDPRKQAVIDRYNRLFEENEGEKVDWGYLLAELIHAYHALDE